MDVIHVVCHPLVTWRCKPASTYKFSRTYPFVTPTAHHGILCRLLETDIYNFVGDWDFSENVASVGMYPEGDVVTHDELIKRSGSDEVKEYNPNRLAVENAMSVPLHGYTFLIDESAIEFYDRLKMCEGGMTNITDAEHPAILSSVELIEAKDVCSDRLDVVLDRGVDVLSGLPAVVPMRHDFNSNRKNTWDAFMNGTIITPFKPYREGNVWIRDKVELEGCIGAMDCGGFVVDERLIEECVCV